MADEELIIPGSRKKAIWVLLAAIALVAVGVCLIALGEFWGWVMVGFFSIAIPIAIWLIASNRSYLRLGRNGVEVMAPWRPTLIRWADVDEFYVATLSGNKMIGIEYSSAYRGLAAGRKVAAFLSGMEGALPNQYQASPEEICATLNQWRQKYAP
jgi:hypothetical protein